ncbi:uncharacterized protein EM151A_4012 (plasmid) [Enterococcus mundtii]|uniref:Uncharacterized protein n=1 Tax=Enterococcus mundtii TaxID=53346 RepID=A0AAI8RC56_ENTMU|nr:hypothetical protein [Enterococcus mundtii]BBM16241.1 uncharacterized protein EM151A_4012 [Enterococcus mundtii]
MKKVLIVGACVLLVATGAFLFTNRSTSEKQIETQTSEERGTVVSQKTTEEESTQSSNKKDKDTNEWQEEDLQDVHQAFLEAAFSYESLDKQREQIKAFAYSEERYSDLGVTDGVPVYQELSSEIVEETSYFREINAEDQEVLTRVHVRYDSDHNHDHETGEHAHKITNQVLLVTIHYRKQGDTWFAYDLTYEEDPKNSQFYSN